MGNKRRIAETDRLLLRRYQEEDLGDLFEYLSDQEVVKYEPYRPLTLEEVKENLKWRISTEEMVAVELKASHKMIGNVYLGKRDFEALELGYVFHRDYWGRGYAEESCRALIEQAFAGGIHRIYAECDPDNERSWKLLERLGFRREAHFRENVYFWKDKAGKAIWKDTYIYAKVASSLAYHVEENLVLVHYCHPNCKPFQNIMRLSEENAFLLAERLAKENPETTAFYRFADFSNYYPLRRKTDQHLYDNFSRLGGKPKEKHPLSFVLQGCDYLEHWFGNGMVYKINLSEIPSDSISFSLGDSCAQYGKTGEIRLLTKEQLLEQIRDFDGSIEDFMDYVVEHYSYIEAQLWDDTIILEQNFDEQK